MKLPIARGELLFGLDRIVHIVERLGNYRFVLRNAFPLRLIPCMGMEGFFQPDVWVCEQAAQANRAAGAAEVPHA